MTEIDSINKMLRYVGELPVPTSVVIDDLPDGHEAKTARIILAEQSRELQSKGWWFNRENWTYIPDDGYITFSPEVIEISSDDEGYLIKGGDLYDVDNQTKVFTESVELVTIFETPLEDLPDLFGNYVLYSAALELHSYLNSDSDTLKSINKSLEKASIALARENLKRSKVNLIKGTRLIDRSTNPTELS